MNLRDKVAKIIDESHPYSGDAANEIIALVREHDAMSAWITIKDCNKSIQQAFDEAIEAVEQLTPNVKGGDAVLTESRVIKALQQLRDGK